MHTTIDLATIGNAQTACASTHKAVEVSLRTTPQRYVQYSGALPRPLPSSFAATSLSEAAFCDLKLRMALHGRKVVVIGLGREGRAAMLAAEAEDALVDVYQPGLIAAELKRLVVHVEKSTAKRIEVKALGWKLEMQTASIIVLAVPASPAVNWEVSREFVAAVRHGSAIIVARRSFLAPEAVSGGLRTGKIGAIYYDRDTELSV